MEPSSALDRLLNAIECLFVLGREVVCVMPMRLSANELLALVALQHEGKITDIIHVVKGPGSAE